jgi:hypothetical protein
MADLYLKQGATANLAFAWGTSETVGGETVLGESYDLTGCQARMQIRKRAGGEVIVEVSSEDGEITLTDGGASLDPGDEDYKKLPNIYVTISDEKTDLLATKRAKWDLKVYFVSGEERRPIEGNIYVSRAITEDA